MRILGICGHSLVLAITNLGAILVGFGVYHLLKPVNQVAVQVPVAAMVCIIGFLSWRFFIQRLSFKGFAQPSGGELVGVYLAALLWSPLIFVPLHYISQGYLTSVGNILGIWLFQIPVNLLVLLAAHKMSGPWLMALLLIAACTAPAQPVATSCPESMVVVPAGWFLMGQDDGPRSNRPQHPVYLDAFAIDRTEVTNAAFAEFITETGYQAAGWDEKLLEMHADEPVVGIVWRTADTYCRWAGKRLPTEAEWEKAARGTEGRRYPWGDAWEIAYANTAEKNFKGVLPVGTFPAGASPYGALDMAGNAAEWVADYFDFDYYRIAPDHNPLGPSAVTDHGLRGGSWASPHQQTQTFFRDSSHSVRPNSRIGFRCALTLPEEFAAGNGPGRGGADVTMCEEEETRCAPVSKDCQEGPNMLY